MKLKRIKKKISNRWWILFENDEYGYVKYEDGEMSIGRSQFLCEAIHPANQKVVAIDGSPVEEADTITMLMDLQKFGYVPSIRVWITAIRYMLTDHPRDTIMGIVIMIAIYIYLVLGLCL